MSVVIDKELYFLESSFVDLTNRLIQEGFNPYSCAAVMTKIAFTMYKSSLNEQEYNDMIDSISESRDKIKTLNEISQVSRLN